MWDYVSTPYTLQMMLFMPVGILAQITNFIKGCEMMIFLIYHLICIYKLAFFDTVLLPAKD